METNSVATKRELKNWEKKWIKDHHKKAFYMTLVNNRTAVRITFFNPKSNKIEMISRSINSHGLRNAKEEAFRAFCQRTGYETPKTVHYKEEVIKKIQNLTPTNNIVYYKELDEIPFNNFFNVDSGFTSIILAKSKAGKSTLLKRLYLEYLKPLFPITILSSGSIHNEMYKDFKGAIKMSTFSDKMVKTAYTINKHTKNRYKFMFMADDMDNHNKYSDVLTDLYVRARNSMLHVFCCVQDHTMLTPCIRANTNYMFIGNQGNERLHIIVEMLYGYLANPNLGKQANIQYISKLVKQATSEYGWIIIDCLNNILYLPDKVKHDNK
jgi:hypothetical protein